MRARRCVFWAAGKVEIQYVRAVAVRFRGELGGVR
jgi:hypothetical protein